MNEDTIFIDGTNNPQNPNNNHQPINTPVPPQQTRQNGQSAAPAVAAGVGGFVGGVALGAAAAIIAAPAPSPTIIISEDYDPSHHNYDTTSQGTAQNTPTSTSHSSTTYITHKTVVVGGGSSSKSHHVDLYPDEPSFAEAFAEARRVLGPGGVFEWHGKLYGTYYKTEWDNMSQYEKNQYWASVRNHTAPSYDDLYYAQVDEYYRDADIFNQQDEFHGHDADDSDKLMTDPDDTDNPYDYYGRESDDVINQETSSDDESMGKQVLQTVSENTTEGSLEVDIDTSGEDVAGYEEKISGGEYQEPSPDSFDTATAEVTYEEPQSFDSSEPTDYLADSSSDASDFSTDVDTSSLG